MQSQQIFLDNLWRLMAEQGVSPSELARRMHTSPGNVAKYIGKSDRSTHIENLAEPTLGKLDQFAAALSVGFVVTSEDLLHVPKTNENSPVMVGAA